jgi:hypothetical protein
MWHPDEVLLVAVASNLLSLHNRVRFTNRVFGSQTDDVIVALALKPFWLWNNRRFRNPVDGALLEVLLKCLAFLLARF